MIWLLACTTSAPTELQMPERPLVPLEVGLLLRRMHLDLAGTLPSLAELEAVRSGEETLDTQVDILLDSERFSSRFQELLAEQWLTQTDRTDITVRELEMDSELQPVLARSVGTEPLALMAEVADLDLAWTETVTADWTMANSLLMEIWPLEPIDRASTGTDDWVPARYTDGRPPAGVAATNGLWWRYSSNPNNYNRSRAAALSRLLLCEDYLLREVSFDAAELADLDPLVQATQQVESCRSCHVTLDPIAAAFFGFWIFDLYDPIEAASYHPEREHLARYFLESEPGWFGVPVDDPGALLAELSADPRFTSCAVERTARAYWRRDPKLHDFETLSILEQGFLAEGQSMKALIRAVLSTPEYRAGELMDSATPAEDSTRTLRVMSPDQLAAVVEQRTGFRWRHSNADPMWNDEHGLRILAGGVDGIQVTEPQQDPSLSRTLVIKRLAQGAADFVVVHDTTNPQEPTLLRAEWLQAAPGDSSFEPALQELALLLWSQNMSPETASEYAAFFTQIEQASDRQQAWTSLVAALMRDPKFWSY
ncbi:MAG: hypothetical protein ACI9VR_000929 [Cognaticolwellia sp.]|jgi:hypothetical protein